MRPPSTKEVHIGTLGCGKQRILVKIRVRAETIKVRNSRVFYCRGGEHFERLKELIQHEDSNVLVSSIVKKDCWLTINTLNERNKVFQIVIPIGLNAW
jgi:hypothetical protein